MEQNSHPEEPASKIVSLTLNPWDVRRRDIVGAVEAELQVWRKVLMPAKQVSIQLKDCGEERHQGVDVAQGRLDSLIARGFVKIKISCLFGVA